MASGLNLWVWLQCIYVTVYAKRGDKSEKFFQILLWLSQLYEYAHIYAKFCAGRLYTFRVTPIFIRGYRKRCLRETAIFMRTAMFPYNSVSRYVQNFKFTSSTRV